MFVKVCRENIPQKVGTVGTDYGNSVTARVCGVFQFGNGLGTAWERWERKEVVVVGYV